MHWWREVWGHERCWVTWRQAGARRRHRPPQAWGEAARPDAGGDAGVSAPGKHGEQRTGRRRVRGVLAAMLVVLFAILLPVTILATWAHRTVANTDAYVATVGPIAASPEVQAALSAEITNEIYAALNPQQTIASALPPKAAKLAGPLSAGAKGYIQDAVNKVLASLRQTEPTT